VEVAIEEALPAAQGIGGHRDGQTAVVDRVGELVQLQQAVVPAVDGGTMTSM